MNRNPENTYAIPEPREEREEMTHEEREEWIHERDADVLESRRDSLNECLKDMARSMDKIASLPFGMKQAGEDA